MNKILSKIHYAIILWCIWNLYQSYESHNEGLKKNKNKVSVVLSKIKKEKKRKKEIEEYLSDIEDTKRRIKIVKSKLELSDKQLPVDKSESAVLELIENVAKKINLKDINIEPNKKEKDEGIYFSREFTVSAVGTFLQFLVLFEKISESERILNINSLEFNKFKEKKRGRFQLISGSIMVEAYSNNENYKGKKDDGDKGGNKKGKTK